MAIIEFFASFFSNLFSAIFSSIFIAIMLTAFFMIFSSLINVVSSFLMLGKTKVAGIFNLSFSILLVIFAFTNMVAFVILVILTFVNAINVALYFFKRSRK